MTSRATLEALLARVLEGTGPDRKLNADIAVTLGGWERKWHDSERPHGWYWRRGDYSWTAEGEGYPADYLGSLDAALTLVPEGWSWHVALRTYLTFFRATGSVWQEGQQRATFTADAATPARALIAACLKARMEAQGE